MLSLPWWGQSQNTIKWCGWIGNLQWLWSTSWETQDETKNCEQGGRGRAICFNSACRHWGWKPCVLPHTCFWPRNCGFGPFVSWAGSAPSIAAFRWWDAFATQFVEFVEWGQLGWPAFLFQSGKSWGYQVWRATSWNTYRLKGVSPQGFLASQRRDFRGGSCTLMEQPLPWP